MVIHSSSHYRVHSQTRDDERTTSKEITVTDETDILKPDPETEQLTAAVSAVEQAVEHGRAGWARALTMVAAVASSVEDGSYFDENGYDGIALLSLIRALAEAITVMAESPVASPQNSSTDGAWQHRARALCAEVLELRHFEDDHSGSNMYSPDDIDALKAKARALLVGVAE